MKTAHKISKDLEKFNVRLFSDSGQAHRGAYLAGLGASPGWFLYIAETGG
jgi:hypothetical protein